MAIRIENWTLWILQKFPLPPNIGFYDNPAGVLCDESGSGKRPRKFLQELRKPPSHGDLASLAQILARVKCDSAVWDNPPTVA